MLPQGHPSFELVFTMLLGTHVSVMASSKGSVKEQFFKEDYTAVRPRDIHPPNMSVSVFCFWGVNVIKLW